MKKLLFFTLFLIIGNIGYSQLVTNSTNTVAYYVQNTLLGSGVTVSNITINGGPANVSNPQIGEFNAVNTTPFLGIDSGLVLASGDIAVAVGPNNSGSFSLGGGNLGFGDPDLDLLEGTGSGTNDAIVLEFDFIPTGDTLSFDFVFGSEEYPEFVNGGFNDAFGFFISGPGIVGPYSNSAINIALVPGTSVPVTIDNVNSGSNASYYVDNTINTGPQSIQFDGYTTPITAIGLVQCGLQYHIKIAIADVGDAAWDSGVFIEGGSFSSNNTISALNAIVPPNITLCTQPYDVNFSAGPSPPINSYWDFGDGLGTSNQNNPMYTYADTGTYTVMYVASDPAACIASDTAYFTVIINLNDSLAATFSFPPPNPCADSMLVQLDFTGSGADSLFWDMGDGTTFINDTSISYYYTTPGTYILTFEAYDTLCNNSYTLIDTVDFNPVITTVNATAPPNIFLCSSPYIVNFTGNAPPPPNSYWDFGDGSGTSNLLNPAYTYQDTGTYNVMYVVIDSSTCNLADTAFFNVTIALNDSLDAQFSFPPYDPCTDSLTVQLDFTGSGADSLYWDMGNGTTFINDTSVNYTYVNPGTYIVTLIAFDLLCNNTFTLTDTVFFNPVTTTVNAVVPPNILLCSAPYEVNFTGNSPASPNSYWDFGDGVGTSSQTNPSYTYANSGLYTVIYVAIDSSTCNIADTVSFQVQITLAPLFSATIDFDPPPPCSDLNSFLVELAFSGTGADSLLWDLGDGTQFNTNSVSYVYSNPGTYFITMTAYNALCGDETVSSEVTFTEINSTTSILPNVFTPNGDGMNDRLEFVGIDNTQEYSIQIFNRWGTKIYEGTDALAHWDGNGSNEGTYFYILKYTDVCNKEEKLSKGTVTLLVK
jgi:gliding motility-associated-like protein